jgi:hypothetical protein
MVKEVSSFCAELKFKIVPDIEALEEGEVDIAESWTVDGISP